MTTIKACTCNHEWQDAEYGKGNRVYNSLPKEPDTIQKWRCTVCNAEK
jgi:hypothetical protein